MGLVTLTFDLEKYANRIKVGNIPSEFGHARPLGPRIIRYVRDGQTDRQTNERTDETTLIAPFPTAGDIIRNLAIADRSHVRCASRPSK